MYHPKFKEKPNKYQKQSIAAVSINQDRERDPEIPRYSGCKGILEFTSKEVELARGASGLASLGALKVSKRIFIGY